MLRKNPFDYLYHQQLYSGTYITYEIAGETSYFIKTRQRSETIYAHKDQEGKITWQTANGCTDEWIQAVGEGIKRYIQ
ncbi:MAG: hypothetical protein KF862_12800 [Chitinophagaceae bacterium]|nr:hypothetical protein [Chitinophagaceae bacterium]